MAKKTKIFGYYGGIRLLKAVCSKFYHLASSAGIRLEKNFSISYSSNIPFGSSLSFLIIYFFFLFSFVRVRVLVLFVSNQKL